MQEMSSAAKKELHELVDALPDSAVEEVREYLAGRLEDDPWRHLDGGDELDEAGRRELHAALEEGYAQAQRGEGRLLEEALADLPRRD